MELGRGKEEKVDQLTAKTSTPSIWRISNRFASPSFEVCLKPASQCDSGHSTKGQLTACKVFAKEQLLTLNLSTVSKFPLYWPILPIAIPKPLMNRESVIEISVLLALREILSSPFSTVQLENAM